MIRIRELPLSLRVAAISLALTLLLGYGAALMHLRTHLEKKDDEKGLTWLDLTGTYSGVEKPAPLLAALDDARHKDDYAKDLTPAESTLLRDWLKGTLPAGRGQSDPIYAAYDALPPGAPEETLLPADVVEQRCNRCHSPEAKSGGDIGRRVSFKGTDIRKFLYAKKLEPISLDILAVSTHTHALSMPAGAILACALLLGTRFRRGIRNGFTCITMLGLFLDLSCMWLARVHPAFNIGIVLGGGLYGLGFVAALMLSILDLCLPLRRGS